MNRFEFASFCLAWLAIAFAPVIAQPPSHDDNAAAIYGDAIAKLSALSQEDFDAVDWQNAHPYSTPTPEVRAALAKAQAALAELRAASRRPYSDFGLNHREGFEMLLPHLGGMRRAAKVIRADAVVRMQQGDSSGAAQALSAIYRMANHLPDDRTLISSLVGQAVFNYADEGLKASIESGALQPADQAFLLASLNEFDGRDPFGLADAMGMEQEMTSGYLADRLADDRRGEVIDLLFEFSTVDPETDAYLRNAPMHELQADLDQYNRLVDEYVEVFYEDDPGAARARLADLEARVDAGEYGPFALALLPPSSVSRILDNLEKSRASLEARKVELESLIDGEVTVGEVANAAAWYLRGIGKLDALDPKWKAHIVSFEVNAPGDASSFEFLDAGETSALSVIKEFVDGSRIRQCDFESARPEWRIFLPAYVAGMRDGLRLLELDAARAHAAGDEGRCLDRLATAIRVIDHLSSDRVILSARIAHDEFDRVSTLIETLYPEGVPNRDESLWLRGALRRLGRSDPFGYHAAMNQSRDQFEESIGNRLSGPDADRDARRREVRDWLETLDGDAMLFLLAIYDRSINEAVTLEVDKVDQHADRLEDYLLPAMLTAAAERVEAYRKAVESGQPETLDLREAPPFVGVEARRATAREDLGRAIARIADEPL
ncbi:MAG: hypothetical protein ACF8PN_00275 [Phycisphaerales bacterium]